MRQIVTTLSAALAVALAGQAHGQTEIRYTGASPAWSNAATWDPANVPDTTSEAALFDGSTGTGGNLEVSGQTVGQIKVVSPSSTWNIMAQRNSPRTLTLSPANSFSNIGIDMSTATVNFAFRNYGDSSSRWLDLNLASSQQWNITSTSETGGDLISLAPGPGGGTGPVRVNLGAHTLTTNIGTGRKIDTAYMDFRSSTGGSLVKTGAGTLQLKRSNSYNGDTTIQAGTIAISGSGAIANSPNIIVGDTGSSGAVLDVTAKSGFSVASAQTLKGIGTVSGDATIAAGGTLAPGASVGTLTVDGDLTLNDGALLAFELDTPAASDQVAMSATTLNLYDQDWPDFTFTTLGGFGVGTYILIDAGAVTGTLGASVTGTIGGLNGELSVDDVNNDLILTVTAGSIVPVIDTLDPADGSSGVLVDANLVVTFDRAVTKGTGNIVIKKTSDDSTVETIDVTSGLVTVDGGQVTINPANNLGYGTGYYVLIDNGAITDFPGISDPATWNFTTESGPVIFALTPEDGAFDVPTTDNLVIEFDKPVTKGVGNIVIKKSSDNSTFETIDVASGQVTVSDTVATINPAGVLALNTGYYVQIDAGAIAGFAGIADTTTWNFTTTSVAPYVITLWPPDDATSVETDPTLTITFDKEVGKGTGNIVIRKSSDDSEVETIDVASGQVTVSGDLVTIDLAVPLDYETGYYVEIDNNAVAGFEGIAGSTTWNFTTWQNLGQANRRFSGGSSVGWNTAGNWTAPDVPNSALEAAIFDGDNGGRTYCDFDTTVDTTIGQIAIRSPQTVTKLYRDRNDSSAEALTLDPATGFGGIGIDMSTATVNFGFQSYNQSSNREMILTLGSDQQWNVTSTATAGDLIFLQNGQELGTGQKINLQGFALTANVGAGRMIDATNGGFIFGTGGSIIKTGDGELRLGKANTYSGNTTVQAGTLRLTGSGSIANSPVITVGDTGSSGAVLEKTSGTFNIGSTQTLKGIGTVSGTVSVAAGGTLAPGASVGTLTVDGNLTLAAGALLAYELATPAASDKVSMTANTLNLNGQEWADFTFTTDTGFGVGTYVLIDAGTVTGSLGASVTGTIGVLYGQLSVDPVEHDLILTVSTSATTYTVTYDDNGADSGSPPVDANSPYLSGATVTVLGNTGGLTLTGSTFAGWNTAGDGSGTPYAPSATFPMPAANLTLYAQWTVAGGFSTWADANAGGQGPEGDFNHNGVPNGVEYLMGGTLASPATLPMPVNTAGTWTWTLPYDPAATDAAWKFQVSEGLDAWTDYQQGDPEVAVLTGPDELELTLPASATGKKFARLVVTIP